MIVCEDVWLGLSLHVIFIERQMGQNICLCSRHVTIHKLINALQISNLNFAKYSTIGKKEKTLLNK